MCAFPYPPLSVLVMSTSVLLASSVVISCVMCLDPLRFPLGAAVPQCQHILQIAAATRSLCWRGFALCTKNERLYIVCMLYATACHCLVCTGASWRGCVPNPSSQLPAHSPQPKSQTAGYLAHGPWPTTAIHSAPSSTPPGTRTMGSELGSSEPSQPREQSRPQQLLGTAHC
jgi:hypothetical protein